MTSSSEKTKSNYREYWIDRMKRLLNWMNEETAELKEKKLNFTKDLRKRNLLKSHDFLEWKNIDLSTFVTTNSHMADIRKILWIRPFEIDFEVYFLFVYLELYIVMTYCQRSYYQNIKKFPYFEDNPIHPNVIPRYFWRLYSRSLLGAEIKHCLKNK